jgi:hypothetical protein
MLHTLMAVALGMPLASAWAFSRVLQAADVISHTHRRCRAEISYQQ